MFAENFFLFHFSSFVQCTWTVVKCQGRNLVYNNFPLHYIIHNSKAHKFLLSGKEEEEEKSSTMRDERKFAAVVFLSLELPTRGRRVSEDEKEKRKNQNCMWFVISLVFVKVTNSISAWETGKPKKKSQRKIFPFDFILAWPCVFMRAVDENKSKKL